MHWFCKPNSLRKVRGQVQPNCVSVDKRKVILKMFGSLLSGYAKPPLTLFIGPLLRLYARLSSAYLLFIEVQPHQPVLRIREIGAEGYFCLETLPQLLAIFHPFWLVYLQGRVRRKIQEPKVPRSTGRYGLV